MKRYQQKIVGRDWRILEGRWGWMSVIELQGIVAVERKFSAFARRPNSPRKLMHDFASTLSTAIREHREHCREP